MNAVKVDYNVTITAQMPDDAPEEARHATQLLIEQAQQQAFAVLATGGPALPVKASLAATLALTVGSWNLLQVANSGDDPVASFNARADFERRFNTLKTCFETEFPHGQD